MEYCKCHHAGGTKKVLFTSSETGTTVDERPYGLSKAALNSLVQGLAYRYVGEGYRINAIAPGFFVTNQNRALLFNEDGTPTARTDKILKATPMGRFGEASELLGAVEWLLDSEKAGFVTGVTIPIDGGFSAYSGV